jgi:hypothetical protein
LDKWEGTVYDSDGQVDVEATIEERRPARKIPPNPPPKAAREDGLDGKALARIAVYAVIDCGSWKNQAVMQFYIDSASRRKGLCFPSEATTARKTKVSCHAVRRANRWWRRHGYRVDGKTVPFLRIAARGRVKPNGIRESNAYHIGWLPLIAIVADNHFDEGVRAEATAILRNVTGNVANVTARIRS